MEAMHTRIRMSIHPFPHPCPTSLTAAHMHGAPYRTGAASGDVSTAITRDTHMKRRAQRWHPVRVRQDAVQPLPSLDALSVRLRLPPAFGRIRQAGTEDERIQEQQRGINEARVAFWTDVEPQCTLMASYIG